MAKIKYMGASDIHKLLKGENFGGQLAEPLTTDIVWNWDNNHVIDTSEEPFNGVPDEVWEIMLEYPEFKDVSDMKRIPTNAAQQLWRGMKKNEPDKRGSSEDDTSEPTQVGVSESGEADTATDEQAGGGPSEASAPAGRGSATTPGSTPGRTGRTGRST